MTLSGSNSYTGGTDVRGGTLVLAVPDSILDGSSLTVGAEAMAIFGTSVSGGRASFATGAVVAVPEPRTLMLLVAGALLASVGTCQRRRS